MWIVKITPKMAIMHNYRVNITFRTWDYIKTERRKLETLLNWWLENENARQWGWYEEEKRQVFDYMYGKCGVKL